MNEIKFRAWDERKKIMHYDFQWMQSGNDGNDWVVFKSDKQPIFNDAIKNPHFTQQLKKMQFTGFEDKNGKEIYKDDIVKINGGGEDVLFRVDFEDGCFVARVPWKEENSPELKYYIGFKPEIISSEVVGNIYENPDLI